MQLRFHIPFDQINTHAESLGFYPLQNPSFISQEPWNHIDQPMDMNAWLMDMHGAWRYANDSSVKGEWNDEKERANFGVQH